MEQRDFDLKHGRRPRVAVSGNSHSNDSVEGGPPSRRATVVVGTFIFLVALAYVLHAAFSRPGGSAPNPVSRIVTVNIALGKRDMVVPPRGYMYVHFAISQSEAGNRWVVGHYRATGGSGNDIRVLLFDSDGFANFQNHHAGMAYYAGQQNTAGDLNVGPLPAGTYYLVFDNSFSLVSNKVVENNIDLRSYPGQ